MFPTQTYEKVYRAINVCLRLSKSDIDPNENGRRLLIVSPDYLLDYLEQYCQNQIANMLRTYKSNNRLYSDQQSFITSFISNITDQNERKLYYDFMWNNESFKSKISTLKIEDKIPYIKNIAGFDIQIMKYEIRDKWQAIAYLEGSKLGAGLTINDLIKIINLETFENANIDIDDLTFNSNK